MRRGIKRIVMVVLLGSCLTAVTGCGMFAGGLLPSLTDRAPSGQTEPDPVYDTE